MSLVREIPISNAFFRHRVESFLLANSLRLEKVDAYYAILDEDENILAGAGISGDIIKCVAVSEEQRSSGMLLPLISHIISLSEGRKLKVFTKPDYRVVFESLGFSQIAAAPKAILLEYGRGLVEYCAYLSSQRRGEGGCVIVMNANPLTLGHVDLVNKAAERYGQVYVIPVREDVSLFSYEERLEMMRSVLSSERVQVLEGSAYQISAATFPTYFLKDLSEASETQMLLDIDLFARHISPSLGARVRVAGSEPYDSLTAEYNSLLASNLPLYGLEFAELPRFCIGGRPVSASAVRAALDAGSFGEASKMVPPECWPYLLSALAERALTQELELPLKPGLVCPGDSGAHSDMDEAKMLEGIRAIRPYFSPMATAEDALVLQRLGIEAEEAMMSATGGVNTHRGAIYSLGLALNSAQATLNAARTAISGREMQGVDFQGFMQNNLCKIAQVISSNPLMHSELHFTSRFSPSATSTALASASPLPKYTATPATSAPSTALASASPAPSRPAGLKDAREMALGGYREVFEDWQPYLRKTLAEYPRETALQRTLLRIMSTLDDTCILRRAGRERLERVKSEAREVLSAPDFENALKELCRRCSAEGISPGGAADMLSLTIFIDSII
ncbi:MAG: triphosphoribosyl-dephospho-CoA synthase [Bacteroidales bacterium]|nr:triphosphoribosyl-dephospho-CoA synthase [Bacteroidales bacterium]